MKPSTRTGNPPQTCSDCGDRYWSWGAHAERCTGIPRVGGGFTASPVTGSWPQLGWSGERSSAEQPVDDVARIIADSGAYRDSDAVRVARAYLKLTETTAA